MQDGLNQLDGYLYWQAELAEARREAMAFCDKLSWLTTGERRDLEEEYARARVDMAKAATRRIADRCTELRAEYEARYQRLRQRTVAVTLGAASCLLVVWELLRK
ncbi:hypothetical protein J4032_16815 [Streptomyces formicae]|uniref:Cytochrome C oxidase subunit I n=1 Tax=Streptomyces formicae TaxID=1616117 RepID=A0ABY3WY23_9ACTN|nr:hypothetical protein J4032_16815 [Streptomyces formicae]